MRRWTVLFAAVAVASLTSSLAPAATKDPFYSQQWGFQRVGAEFAWKVSRGSGVLIAVIDSGVDLQHPDLKDKVTGGKDYIEPGTDADDAHGHGTLVAGITAASTDNVADDGKGIGIASVAPDARILPVRVFGTDGTANSNQVAEAIRWSVDDASTRNMKLVLNLSFAGPPDSDGIPDPSALLFADKGVENAILDAANRGAAVIAASGNDGAAKTAFDAPDNRGIIVVGSSDEQDRCANFTNYGAGLDIMAPGVKIISTYWNRHTGESVYASADGTSLSVPFVAGAAAVLMSNGMTNVTAVQRMIATASGPGVSCRSEATRYKVLDLAAAAGVARSVPQKPPSPSPRPTVIGPSPSPSPSPVPLVLPSPGEAPLLVVEAPSPSPSLATGSDTADSRTFDPLEAIAAALVIAVGGLHGFRKKLI